MRASTSASSLASWKRRAGLAFEDREHSDGLHLSAQWNGDAAAQGLYAGCHFSLGVVVGDRDRARVRVLHRRNGLPLSLFGREAERGHDALVSVRPERHERRLRPGERGRRLEHERDHVVELE